LQVKKVHVIFKIKCREIILLLKFFNKFTFDNFKDINFFFDNAAPF
jgi:hypothetical protein